MNAKRHLGHFPHQESVLLPALQLRKRLWYNGMEANKRAMPISFNGRRKLK